MRGAGVDGPGPTRAALYYRVSSEEQVEGYSLDAQARACTLYCDAHGWTIVREYRDEGRSARSEDLSNRPQFSAMLRDAETRLIDVIIVHKLDRFARNLRVTLETLDRLSKHDVAFVSISEQMDFTTPIGKVILATLGAFAQYYSDNLSIETKKGKHERKAQGMYNGLLPFGVKKNDDGLPVPDPETYPGLLTAFKAAAEGKSDREVAVILNAAGYRTTGNRGQNPFRKDTVRRILINRFYLGELPDGAGGWMSGKHHPMLDADLFDAAQAARAKNQTNALKVRRALQTYSLSGLAICGYCGGPLHVKSNRQGRPRLYCYNGGQADPCQQPSTYLDICEVQLQEYLASIRIPEDYQDQIMALYRQAHAERSDDEARRRQIISRLERIRELYGWGDLDRSAYRQERDALTTELATLVVDDDRSRVLARAATFLSDLPLAWGQATQAQRNRLARLIFQQVRIHDDRVVAVLPQPDFMPFFALEALSKDSTGGSDGIRTRDLSLDRAAC